jgi:hypothetical protein
LAKLFKNATENLAKIDKNMIGISPRRGQKRPERG